MDSNSKDGTLSFPRSPEERFLVRSISRSCTKEKDKQLKSFFFLFVILFLCFVLFCLLILNYYYHLSLVQIEQLINKTKQKTNQQNKERKKERKERKNNGRTWLKSRQ